MSEHESFAKPPVEEAIITMRLRPLGDPEGVAKDLSVSQRDPYPLFESGDPRMQPRSVRDSDLETEGFRLISQDGRNVVQLTRRTFSIHRLKPYEGWATFVGSAHAAWTAFAALTNPDEVQSVHLRYLNRLELPDTFREWGDYLQIRPAIPSSLAHGLQNYMVALDLIDASVPAQATLTQVTLPLDDGALPLLVDVDVRSMTSFKLDRGDQAVWRTLERMSEYKNRIFFESLTERTKELFR